MSVIRIDPGEVQGTASNFNSMSSEVAELVNRARSMMGNLESQFTGSRASKIFQQWHEMEPRLQAAVTNLESAGRLLKSAADDFSAADMR